MKTQSFLFIKFTLLPQLFDIFVLFKIADASIAV